MSFMEKKSLLEILAWIGRCGKFEIRLEFLGNFLEFFKNLVSISKFLEFY